MSGSKDGKVIFALFSVLVIICLIIPSYVLLVQKEEKQDIILEKKDQMLLETDNRISPLTNQGIILEINRIRNRGLLEKIMKIGPSWRQVPKFYLNVLIDGQDYSSFDEFGYTFNVWDTLGQDFRIIKDAEEEQIISEITIFIMQEEKKGLFRKEYTEKEKIELEYDYKTGQWTGDDSYLDIDGYGHFIGSNYELWFNVYQTDFDHDNIPYWTEVNILKTDPRVDDSIIDTDYDGVPNSWEFKWGYDPFVWDDHQNLDPDIDGLKNIEEYFMSKWFANPFCQDIYIEVDGMQKRGIFDKAHTMPIEVQQIIIERFCQNNINMYIDSGWPGQPDIAGGELLAHENIITWDSGNFLKYYKYNFADERKGIFRYLLMCHSTGKSSLAFSGNTKFNQYDTMIVGMRSYERLLPPRIQRLLLASTVLHEIGHTLSIAPYTIEGCDNASFLNSRRDYKKEWGNYRSVMNYFYSKDITLVDYSDGSHGYNDQNDWLNFYLPFFQIENNCVIEPGIMPPATDRVVNEDLKVKMDGWKFSKNLTNQFKNDIKEWSPIEPIKCNWIVYESTDSCRRKSNRNLRIYARPEVPISQWSLVFEAYTVDNKIITA